MDTTDHNIPTLEDRVALLEKKAFRLFRQAAKEAIEDSGLLSRVREAGENRSDNETWIEGSFESDALKPPIVIRIEIPRET